MPGRIYLANVGANASHRFAGPIFEHGCFEFLPIPESPNISGPHAVRFRDLHSFNTPERDLTEYVPRRLWNASTHNDPEFSTFTYGDNCEASPRAASLKQMELGDFLFFIVRLASSPNTQDAASPRSDEPITYGFYLIGFLEVESVLRSVRSIQAFKEVEVSVRETGGFASEDIGVKLMRKAFATNDGPLSDTSTPEAEQEALAHLFAGAIGSYKNPHSHRSVEIDSEEAVEMVILASHLLNIVDSRG